MPAYEWYRDFLKAALADLPAYLRSADLFWTLTDHPPTGAPPFPQLTVGNVLLALDGLAAMQARAGGDRWAEILQLEAEWEAARRRWAAHIESKAVRELASRVRQWSEYVRDATETGSAEDYPVYLHPRLAAERLMHLVSGVPQAEGYRRTLADLDARLQPQLTAGGFVLDAALQPRYPEAAFPFLYRRPR